jgi:hypothetical protein
VLPRVSLYRQKGESKLEGGLGVCGLEHADLGRRPVLVHDKLDKSNGVHLPSPTRCRSYSPTTGSPFGPM